MSGLSAPSTPALASLDETLSMLQARRLENEEELKSLSGSSKAVKNRKDELLLSISRSFGSEADLQKLISAASGNPISATPLSQSQALSGLTTPPPGFSPQFRVLLNAYSSKVAGYPSVTASSSSHTFAACLSRFKKLLVRHSITNDTEKVELLKLAVQGGADGEALVLSRLLEDAPSSPFSAVAAALEVEFHKPRAATTLLTRFKYDPSAPPRVELLRYQQLMQRADLSFWSAASDGEEADVVPARASSDLCFVLFTRQLPNAVTNYLCRRGFPAEAVSSWVHLKSLLDDFAYTNDSAAPRSALQRLQAHSGSSHPQSLAPSGQPSSAVGGCVLHPRSDHTTSQCALASKLSKQGLLTLPSAKTLKVVTPAPLLSPAGARMCAAALTEVQPLLSAFPRTLKNQPRSSVWPAPQTKI